MTLEIRGTREVFKSSTQVLVNERPYFKSALNHLVYSEDNFWVIKRDFCGDKATSLDEDVLAASPHAPFSSHPTDLGQMTEWEVFDENLGRFVRVRVQVRAGEEEHMKISETQNQLLAVFHSGWIELWIVVQHVRVI